MIKKVEICGVNTSKLPVLTNEEKEKLFIEIKKGNEEARQKFINGNLKLVLSVIKRFNNRNENADDLFQVGCIGLIKAIDNFDLSQNVLFSTYAVPMIIGEIRRHLRDNNSIRVSRSLRDIAYKSLQMREQILNEENRDATIEEIAQRLGLEKEEISHALDAIQEPVSLYEPVYNDGADALFIMDQISDNKNIDENWIEDIAISEGLNKLSERERNIIKKRFFDGKTQMEVAEEIGISQAQVSRLEKTALLHMRKSI
ncbi:MAG: RNA polymerase sporulation sigma factor SigG [Clostridia bacterium]|nr:RNA polymerase sporulation sigma factor SigG [Clostridia bacterium]